MFGRPALHWLLLFGLVAMWGSSFMLTKIAVSSIPPAVVVTGRLLLAAGLLLVLVFSAGKRLPTQFRHWKFFIALALMGNALPFWLISWGQQGIDSGLAGVLMAIMPLTTLLLAHFFVAEERLNAAKIFGFLLGFCGIVVLMGPKAVGELRGHGTVLWFELAVLSGAICYAINAIVARRRPESDAVVGAAGIMVMASLMMAPVAAFRAPGSLAVVSGPAILAVVVLGVMSTAVATVVFLRLIAMAGPTFVSFINYLIPIWAVLIGMIFLGEQPSWDSLVALALILGGIALAETLGRR